MVRMIRMNPDGIYCDYWFRSSIDEVALITHKLYHDLDYRYKTMSVIVQQTGYDEYTVIAIYSLRKISKKELIEKIKSIPSKESVW
jgi:predicted MarR family transcription regulator